MLVQCVLFDGFDPLDVLAPYEVLYMGGAAVGGALTVELVSAEGAREVPSGLTGVSLRAVGRLDPRRADVIVVPGAASRVLAADTGAAGEPDPDAVGAAGEAGEAGEGAGETGEESVPALLARTLRTDLPALLKEALDTDGLTVATVCGGSLVLAMAGLIEGRPATTHRLGLDALDATGAVVVDARVVDDGDLISAAGVTSGLDLGLHLLDREVGPRVAQAVERLFAHERRGIVWRPVGPEPVGL